MKPTGVLGNLAFDVSEMIPNNAGFYTKKSSAVNC